MAWNTGLLRAEIALEFGSLRVGETRVRFSSAGLAVHYHHRRVWSREAVACPTCGARFTPLHGRRKYCSRRCHNRFPAPSRIAWNARRAAKRLTARSNRTCANTRCRATFIGRRSDSLYCSGACRDRWRALRYQRRQRETQ